ncbi:MAG: metallophosphoesterase [Planctomycetes bacterium]|jgi:hypothetical protein|nr:metallophosphoesterase [Planctomycetota bacterium]
MSAQQAIDLLMQAAELNRGDPLRNGQLLHFPAVGELLATGDLHNHRRNFQRIMNFAALERFSQRHVVLHELIHGGPLGPDGEDTSLELLLDALDWALQYPGQVHFLMANHDLAQLHASAIMKDGYDLTERFERCFSLWYGGSASHVAAAFRQFVLSMPLAGITVSGALLSHSLPGVRDMVDFDVSILRRPLDNSDFQRTGSVYKMLWGRSQTAELLASLSKQWWADIYICGHQEQDRGYGVLGKNLLVLDSSHNHGVLLPMVLDRQYTIDDLIQTLIPLASLK